MGDHRHKRLQPCHMGQKLHQNKDAPTADVLQHQQGNHRPLVGLLCVSRYPSGSHTWEKTLLGEIYSSIREEKFGLGQENRWKAALLFKVEVNTTFRNASFLRKWELCFFSKHGEFIFSADIKPPSTENKGACTMWHSCFLWFYF